MRHGLCILSNASSTFFNERDHCSIGITGPSRCFYNKIHATCLVNAWVSSIFGPFSLVSDSIVGGSSKAAAK